MKRYDGNPRDEHQWNEALICMTQPHQSEFSRPVTSNQAGIHPRLAQNLQRHLNTEFQRPVAPHSKAAYQELATALGDSQRPIVLDSFCGTGMSTAILAARHPDHFVIGIDQSAHRLGKHISASDSNYLLLRANAEDLWQLLLQNGHLLAHHYLLYPNPWPKSKHLQRRVHGHSSFPALLALGGEIEVRSNWQLYLEEFGVAMFLAGRPGTVAQISGEPSLTLFEEKYRLSGHSLWRFHSPPP
ncbi:MAG: SAM-dependent methyltransferase [Halioglobus sp.]|jgi:tRNA (guanine-N7-)-methyltransferase|nr:SAM-dependent methyltransferase [Halieaceae bacterium]MBT5007977.1 SAM-dependent methyltransferase [Halieaceae bacterium]MBT6123558.1 SAM-dependent methyltransferase [Halieaceae bacterium]MDG1389636.1 SAM-dependent methyltransferase [Halioglobus sp.]MDG2325564.1 SAM-dependent methyltransferase [Halioglobus sp.]